MQKNEDGLVKCLKEDGTIRWMPEHLVNDATLLKSLELTVAPSIKKLEPIIELENVAEAVVAEKPRKQK